MDFSKLNLNGIEYNVKDEKARNDIEKARNDIEKARNDIESYIIDEITIEKRFYEETKTNYYIAHIPHTDKDGNIIKLKRGFANDIKSNIRATETVRDFANRKNATLCINASIFDNQKDSATYKNIIGLIINDGIVINSSNSSHEINEIMGIKEDNTFVKYSHNVSSEQILNDGCINTVNAFQHLIIGNIKQSLFEEDKLYQWLLIGQNSLTKDLYIICCDGKGIVTNKGMYKMTLADILNLEFSCDYVYQLDGGGSTSLVYKGELINTNSDYSEREVPDYIYFSKEAINESSKQINELNKKTGNVLFNEQNRGGFLKYVSIFTETSESSIDDIEKNSIVYCTGSALNSPYDTYDSIIQTFVTQGGSSLQIAYPFNLKSEGESLGFKRRRRINGVWQPWEANETEWKSLSNEYGTLNYKIKDDVLYLDGSFKGFNEHITLNIPNITLNKTGYLLCTANGTFYTKAVMNVDGNFQIFVGTGSTTDTTYNVSGSFPIK